MAGNVEADYRILAYLPWLWWRVRGVTIVAQVNLDSVHPTAPIVQMWWPWAALQKVWTVLELYDEVYEEPWRAWQYRTATPVAAICRLPWCLGWSGPGVWVTPREKYSVMGIEAECHSICGIHPRDARRMQKSQEHQEIILTSFFSRSQWVVKCIPGLDV